MIFRILRLGMVATAIVLLGLPVASLHEILGITEEGDAWIESLIIDANIL